MCTLLRKRPMGRTTEDTNSRGNGTALHVLRVRVRVRVREMKSRGKGNTHAHGCGRREAGRCTRDQVGLGLGFSLGLGLCTTRTTGPCGGGRTACPAGLRPSRASPPLLHRPQGLRCSTRRQLSKARLKRVSSRPVWMHWSAVACGLWSRATPARSGSSPVWHTCIRAAALAR